MEQRMSKTETGAESGTESDAGYDACVIKTLESICARLDSIEQYMTAHCAPSAWSSDDIARWIGLSKFTVEQRVVTRLGFPKPMIPSGIAGAQKRWFAHEVIKYLDKDRGNLPSPRPKTARKTRTKS